MNKTKQHNKSDPVRPGRSKTARTRVASSQVRQPSSGRSQSSLVIVAIGASAGGLEAIEQFLDHMPADRRIAFFIVVHRSTDQPTLLSQVLSSHTPMPVMDAVNGMAIEPSHVYVGTPGHYLVVRKNKLYLLTLEKRAGSTLPIDYCFRSVAEDRKRLAVGILLSGMGSDGTIGLRRIKDQGGLTMVQDPASAQHRGMPDSAIGADLADYVLPPNRMPDQLLRYVANPPLMARVNSLRPAASPPAEAWDKIMILIRDQAGHDFSCYKPSAIFRRIERRMNIHHIKDLTLYGRFLEETPNELTTLANELLIGVTSFFRDIEAWKAFGKALKDLLAEKSIGDTVRIWNPGCSSGEEAYSLAICLREGMETLKRTWPIKLFATDVDERAVQTARAGQYPEGIAAEIAPDHLSKYFTKEDHVFVVRKEIRAMMTFAKQDIIGHPPFTQLDVLCCRNLLIYLEPRMQQQILRLFHHALKPNGLLFLGMSETTSSCPDFFTAIDQKWKLFRRRETPAGAYTMSREVPKSYLAPVQDRSGTMRSQKAGPVAEDFPRLLLQQHLPPSVVINLQGEIFYIHGQTGAYLEPATGEPTLHPNLFTMIREGLKPDVLSAVRRASSQDAPIMLKGCSVKTNGLIRRVDVAVRRMREPDPKRGLLIVTFTSAGGIPSGEQPSRKTPLGKRKQEEPRTLGRQLERTREQLHDALHDLGVAKEELTATNEEWASTVEELQSTNEELEASREELQSLNEELTTVNCGCTFCGSGRLRLQSLNEELTTVNAELQSKIEQLSDSTNDMLNLLNSQDVAILFLDKTFRIKRFTPQMQLLIHLTKADIGRPISDFTTQFTYEHLPEDAAEVFRTLASKEREIAAQNGRWYTLRITPYRREETQIDGLVLTFSDVSRLKHAEQRIQAAQAFAESIVATVRQPLLVLDADLRVISANAAFYTFFQVSPVEVQNQLVYQLGNGQWASPDLRRLLDEILPKNTVLENFPIDHIFPAIGRKRLRLNARRLKHEGELLAKALILLAMEEDRHLTTIARKDEE